jgi:porin
VTTLPPRLFASIIKPRLLTCLSVATYCCVPTIALAGNDFAQSTATGDWGGTRQHLADEGIKLTGDYVSETFHNYQGGIKNGTRYTQQIRLGAQFDLSKLLDVDNGGTVQLSINDRRGNSASDDLVGNRLSAQESYGGQYTRLSELSYARSVLDPDLTAKVGYMAMGNDFGGLPLLTNFVSAGFCSHPLSMSGGSGWGNYPAAHLGAELKYALTPELFVQTAVFNVNSENSSRVSRAFSMSGHGTSGAILPLELVYAPGGDMPGQYKAGWYYDSSNTARIGRDDKASGRSGSYLLGDQTIWHEDGDTAHNVHVFTQLTNTDTATSPFKHWYSAGLVLNKPFANRPHDSVGLGYGRAVLNHRTRAVQEAAAATSEIAADISNLDTGEQLVEVNYGVQVTSWLMVKPDIQYIIEPGAFYGDDRGNALLAGLQVKATF